MLGLAQMLVQARTEIRARTVIVQAMGTGRAPAFRGQLARCDRRARAAITDTAVRRAGHLTVADTETHRVRARRRRTAIRARRMVDRHRRIEDRLLRIVEGHRIARLPIEADRLPTVEARPLTVQQRRLHMAAATVVEVIVAAEVAEAATTAEAGAVAPTAEAVVVGMPRQVEDMADIAKKS